jgi:hypothetical protein
MSIQGMDILKISIAIAPAELSNVGLGPEMLFECFLVTENRSYSEQKQLRARLEQLDTEY